MNCHSCNRMNPEGSRFCGFCGVSLQPAPVSKPMPTPVDNNESNADDVAFVSAPIITDDMPDTKEVVDSEALTEETSGVLEQEVFEKESEPVLEEKSSPLILEDDDFIIPTKNAKDSDGFADVDLDDYDDISPKNEITPVVPAVSSHSYSGSTHNPYAPKVSSDAPSPNAYTTPPTSPNSPPPQTKKPNLAPVVSTSNFFWSQVLFMIPVVNIIMMLVWSFSADTNPNKRNFSRSFLIMQGILLILSIISMIIFIFLVITGSQLLLSMPLYGYNTF